VQWGSASDLPVPADYDGDGRTDLMVWRFTDGMWYLLSSSSQYAYSSARAIQWGNSTYGDRPVGSALPISYAFTAVGECPDGHPGRTAFCVAGISPPNYPVSQDFTMYADLREFGLSAAVWLPPCHPCGGTGFDLDLHVPASMTPGVKKIPVLAFDEIGRRADGTISIRILP
jgi:hypothetical protein